MSVGQMWWDEPVTDVPQEPLALAPADANLVSATCKDRSMPSVMPSRASANVSTGYMHGSVTDVYLGTGAFLPASPANAMGMRMTVTR